MKLRASIVDVETTGLNPATDEVVELALVLFSFDPRTGGGIEVLEEYSGLRDPGRPIPPGATRAHGITDDDVRGRQLDEARIRSILARSHCLIAHNAAFDRPFVERLFPEAKRLPWLCSMDGIDWRARGHASKGLQQLLAAHGIAPGSAHRALDDARATLRLLATAQPEGQTYLAGLMARLHQK
ncbi:MAG: exonuclease domain-containing protein [Bryobacteraceae bacterium]|nr:exonuclease domain-containing protein [Bryobacteraceae bacterium]